MEEIKAPFNFKVDENPIKFVISSKIPYQVAPDGKIPIITVTMENVSVKGKINVKKTGEQLVSVTKDELGNVQFNYEKPGVNGTEFIIKASEDIYSADNQGDILYHKDDIVAELTTVNGFAETVQLPLGKYKIYESIAGNNFVLNKEVKEVELTYKDQNTSVVFENVDYENKRQIETLVSDRSGKVTFKTDLPLCLLEMKEIESPFSYELSSEIIEVDASYQGQDKETIEKYAKKYELEDYVELIQAVMRQVKAMIQCKVVSESIILSTLNNQTELLT